MLRHAIKRLLVSIPVLLGVLFIGFMLMQIVPTDPATVLAGPTASAADIEAIRESMGLNEPVIVQFGIYLGRVLQGDLGRSLISNSSVVDELANTIGPTIELMCASLIWAIPLGILFGTLAAVRRGKASDRIIMAASVAGVSMPIFWFGLMLIQYVGFKWQILPFQGRAGPLWTIEGLRHIILPAITLGGVFVGPVARMTRTSLLEVLSSDFVRTARAKGVSERVIVLKHALRNSLIPVVTLIGLQIGFLLGGAVVTETMFAWPGVGRLAVGAIVSADYALSQGAILVLALSFIIVNIIVDLLYAVLDPRLRGVMTEIHVSMNPVDEAPATAVTARRTALKKLMRDKGAVVSFVILTIIVTLALAAPLIAPHNPYDNNLRNMLKPPAWADAALPEHLLGTDGLGRDIVSRLLYGTRTTLMMGVMAVLAGGIIGSFMGLMAAYYKWLEGPVMRIVDILLSFPSILFGLAIAAVLGAGIFSITIALTVSAIPTIARITRGAAVVQMQMEYITASRAVGMSDARIIWLHLLPNSASTIFVYLTLQLGQTILLGAALSFIGLGAQPPTAELGTMASEGRNFLFFAPHVSTIPSLVIFLIVLCFNVLGDALRDVLDPRLRQ